ncbi:phosphate regulon sensor histidine kinase PhoR [Azotobacter vinelandii]
MKYNWLGPLLRSLLAPIAVGLLLGLFLGDYGWSLSGGLAAYLAWNLYQLIRLHHWLKTYQPDEPPPDASGLWGEVFDGLYNIQRRDQRVRGRLQAVIDRVQESTAALKDAVIMLDAEGNLEWWNRAAETLLGLKTPQDSGQPITNLVRHPQFKTYMDQSNFSASLELPSPLNDRLYLQVQITRYGNGEQLMLVRDVTHVRQLEQMRKDFVANVSHELRTPLTVIAGYLEPMLEHADEVNPRWRRPLQQMQQQAERMKNLLDDLLLLARLEANDNQQLRQPVEVEPLLQAIVKDAQILSGADEHRILLDAEPDLALKGNEAELSSAFSNLVYNAVKYTPAGGEIRLRWWSDRDGAHLSVQDTGIGIESRHLTRLTERFYRVDASRSASTGGTGLGLAIVKHALIHHNGRLEIASEPGKGSLFTCHFPATQLMEGRALGNAS